jgi:predicted  nucleic acid-binding Zn-ribbon protein
MSLKEDLQTLSDAIPLLGKNMPEVLHGAEALETAAQELQTDVDAARAEVAAQLTMLHDALPGLAVHVEADEKRLAEAGTAVTDAWQKAAQELERDGEQVANQVDDVMGEVHGLREVLAEAGTRIDQSQAVGEAALARLQHDAQEAGQRLHAALQAMQTEVGNFHSFTDTARQQLTAAAGALLSRLMTISSDAQSGAQEAMETFKAKGGAHKEAAHGVVSAISQQIMDKVDGVGGQIEHDVTTPVGEEAEGLRNELERLGAGAGKHEEALAKHGQVLETALEQAKGEVGPVRAGIGQIQEAARKVGVA